MNTSCWQLLIRVLLQKAAGLFLEAQHDSQVNVGRVIAEISRSVIFPDEDAAICDNLLRKSAIRAAHPLDVSRLWRNLAGTPVDKQITKIADVPGDRDVLSAGDVVAKRRASHSGHHPTRRLILLVSAAAVWSVPLTALALACDKSRTVCRKSSPAQQPEQLNAMRQPVRIAKPHNVRTAAE